MDSQEDLFRFLNQSEHSSISDSAVSPLADEAKKCKCGCGQEIKIRYWYRWGGIPNYIRGHHKSIKYKRINNLISCACGCGNKLLTCDYKGRIRKYIHGHNSNGVKKGSIPWSYGLTKETDERIKKISDILKNHPSYKDEKRREKLSRARKGKTWEDMYGIEKARYLKQKQSTSQLGEKNNFYKKHHTLTTKKILREQKIGKKISEEHKENIKRNHPHLSGAKSSLFGKKLSIERRIKTSAIQQGIPVGQWKGFKSPILLRIRKSSEMKQWREKIFERDDWTCQECYIRGKRLHVHHIRKFSKFSSLRFDVNNGISLCKSCHDKILWKEDNFIEYFENKIQVINLLNLKIDRYK